MDSDNDPVPPSLSTVRPQGPHPGRRSLLPANVFGPQHVLPSYPSSTLQYYYPFPHHAANYVHISAPMPTSHSHPPLSGDFVPLPLPSASQSHIPSLRRTPSVSPIQNIHTQPFAPSPVFDQQNSNHPADFQRIQTFSPVTVAQPQPLPFYAAPQPVPLPPDPIPLPPNPIPATYAHLQHPHLAPIVPHATTLQTSYITSSLPSTKDIPILSGKHDWGPWHSAVHALIMNANLLGHIADDPLPGAIFDPGLWPMYPPTVHQTSTPAQLQSFTEWWSRDGLASHILTSHLSSSILGSLPIANEHLGHRRSARTVYITLRHHFGAGDYSTVMVIEARLRQLRCLPTHRGVCVTDFITTWRISINQMKAAGFLPGTRQLLSIFVDGLPNHTVAFINLYNDIISSLNEPLEQSLPNIHYLFDRTTHIENSIQRNRILHPTLCRPPQTQHNVSTISTSTIISPMLVSTSTTVPPAPVPNSQGLHADRQSTSLLCSNCGRPGHTVPTCFQPGGGMEGCRDEYLASRQPKPIAHIAEVEENLIDVEEDTTTVEENALNNEFAAMLINISNEIQFSTYVLASFPDISSTYPFAFSSITLLHNSALDSACTNHIFRDRNLFHTYNVDSVVPVKTANCSFLTTLGIGDIKIRLIIGNRTIVWMLTNCLHAPSVPINLISVGALQEHRMSVTFSFNKTTISFPNDHQHLSGLLFDAHVAHQLSLLKLDFIPPPTLPVALQLFPIVQPSPEIWLVFEGPAHATGKKPEPSRT